MPELPEVENIALGLRQEIISLVIEKAYVHQPLILRGPYAHTPRRVATALAATEITAVTRRAKRLIITTNTTYSIIVQLGMTGTFRITPTNQPRPPHSHWSLKLSDSRYLQFIDPRRFGRVWLLDYLDPTNPDPIMLAAGLGKLGPEPFDINPLQFQNLLSSIRPIKSLLLDQTRIAGLGNIYADESLFAANIHPATLANQIDKPSANRLLRAIKTTLRRAITHGGTTFSDFRNPYGDPGRFLNMLRVYQRTSQPCKRCKTPIDRLVISGRSSHFCPNCQKA